MKIHNNFSLVNHNSFGIEATAEKFISISSTQELEELISLNSKEEKIFIGGGSNILITRNIKGLVINLNMKGISSKKIDDTYSEVKINSGENWNDSVKWCLKNNLGGIENLSLIPGNTGAAPIQNIGAYGVELKDVFISCEAMNIQTQELRTFNKEECDFGYRNSIFKEELKGQYIITSVIFELSSLQHVIKKKYGDIESELKNNGIENPTIQDISKAVISIRNSKLPNPKVLGNSGSFFKNPMISCVQFQLIKNKFPKIPHYKVSETTVKIPAGWLIETVGFKGKTFKNYGVHNKQALVLVNYGNASGKDILELSKKIQEAILIVFDIVLEIEVNIL